MVYLSNCVKDPSIQDILDLEGNLFVCSEVLMCGLLDLFD